MKIKINEYETYEITLPEQISKQQFFEILSRFQLLAKTLSKDEIMEVSKGEIKTYEKKPIVKRKVNTEALQKIRNDRRMNVEIWKAYYTQNLDIWNTTLKKYGMEEYLKRRDDVARGIIRKFRDVWKITPQECGLKAFPKQHHKNLDTLR